MMSALTSCAAFHLSPKTLVLFDTVHRTLPLPEGAGFSLYVALP